MAASKEGSKILPKITMPYLTVILEIKTYPERDGSLMAILNQHH